MPRAMDGPRAESKLADDLERNGGAIGKLLQSSR